MKKILTLLCMLMVFSQLNAKDVIWTSPPDVLSSSGVNASNGQIGVDLSGNAVAIWIEAGNVMANTKPFGGSWGTATIISAGTGTASSPRLVVDGNGNATALWLDGGIVNTSTLPSGGSWGSIIALSSTGSSSPQISVDATGNLVAVWVNGGFVQSATQLFGGSWPLTPDTISISGTPAAPQVAIGNGGRVTAVWHDSSLLTVSAVSKSTISGSWGVAQVISSGGVNSVYPQIAVDGSGNVIACWFRYLLFGSAYTNVVVQSANQPSGGLWTTPVDISPTGMDNPANLFLKVRADDQGNAVAAWTESDDGFTFAVLAAIKQKNKNWTSSNQIFSGSTTVTQLNLALTSFGNAFVAFTALNLSTSNLDIQVANSDIYAGTDVNSWDGPIVISSTAATPNAFPRIAAVLNQTTNTFYTAAIWLNCTSSVLNIQSSIGSGPILEPPTGLTLTSGTVNLCVFSQNENTLNWTASTSPDASNTVILRNGILIAVLPASTTSFIDPNRFAEVDTYQVAVNDGSFSQSAYATAP